jgi:hypothetical protein
MLADFKISSITNLDNGTQYIKFRFSEGAITTEEERDSHGDMVSVTRYRRSALLHELGVTNDSQLSDSEIDALGRVELAKIADHDPIEEQRVA